MVTGEMEPPLNGPCTRRGGPAACSCWSASWKQVSRATNIYRFSERAFSSYVYPCDSCLTLHTPACSLAPRPYARTHGHTGAHTPPSPRENPVPLFILGARRPSAETPSEAGAASPPGTQVRPESLLQRMRVAAAHAPGCPRYGARRREDERHEPSLPGTRRRQGTRERSRGYRAREGGQRRAGQRSRARAPDGADASDSLFALVPLYCPFC